MYWKKILLWSLVGLIVATTFGCKPDDLGEPSFIRVDDIRIVCPSQGAISTDTGFYTSDVRAAYVVLKRRASLKEDTIGLFNLPMTVPILYSGEVDYLEFSPAVQQSGQQGAMVYYSFYDRVKVSDLTLNAGDTLHIGTLQTTYRLEREDALFFEPFEPTAGSLMFDSVMQWVTDDPEGARSGRGYGVLHIDDSTANCLSRIDRDFYVTDPTKAVYLEFDARSDVEFVLGTRISARGENEQDAEVMRIYANDHWVHIYANIGRNLAYYAHPEKFGLFFKALNTNGTSGDVRIDNVRLLTTSHTL